MRQNVHPKTHFKKKRVIIEKKKEYFSVKSITVSLRLLPTRFESKEYFKFTNEAIDDKQKNMKYKSTSATENVERI